MDGEGECAVVSEVYGRRVALLACGSFNPPTYMHLRMFVRARDYLEKTHNCVVVEGILSPVADSFRKPDLLTAEHRLKMVELAVRNSTWLRADGWECSQSEWTRTLHVLNHFKKQLERKYGDGPSGIRLMFLCGGDVVESFAKTDAAGNRIWNPEHVEEIVRDFGLVVIARTNSDPMKTVYLIDVLRKHQKNIHVIEDETCPNDISSTRLRTAVRRRESIRYCTDDEVISYIEKNNLYSFSSLSLSRGAVPENVISSSNSPPTLVETTVKCLRPPQPPKRNSSVAMQKIHHLTPSSPLDSSCKPAEESPDRITDVEPVWLQSSEEAERRLEERMTESEVVDATAERQRVPKSVVQRKTILTPAEQCLPSTSYERPHTTLLADVPSPPSELYSHSWMRSLDSPNYDNVTLDELLAASTSWAEYLCAQKGKKLDDNEGAPRSLLMRTKSLGRESQMNVDEHQWFTQLPPDAQDRSVPQEFSVDSAKGSAHGKPSWREGAETRSFSAPQRRSIRFASALTKSVESLAESASSPAESMSRSMVVGGHEDDDRCGSGNSGNITLTYRQYKLSATPETTV
uniref:Nicotinamide/nicotinic acid mononucleotide adenylyltransferase 3 n=1 Tax=Parascaris univalens TaxID=6257 RepID=A0A915C117_PARUN